MHEIFANTPEKAYHYWQLMELEYREKNIYINLFKTIYFEMFN